MITQWALYVVFVIVGYLGVSWFAYTTGGLNTSVWGAFFATLRPLPLIIIVSANISITIGLFYGFGITRLAIPAAISMGVITSFIYSILIAGAQLTLTKIAGIAVIILGVVMLAF